MKTLTDKIKKAVIPTLAGVLFATGLYSGFKGDSCRYGQMQDISPRIKFDYIMGYVSNREDLSKTEQERIMKLESRAGEYYTTTIGLWALSGLIMLYPKKELK